MVTFTGVWFNEALLGQNFEFHKGYRVPISRNIQTYTDYIASLPANDTPEVFGLHSNADITYQITTAKGNLYLYTHTHAHAYRDHNMYAYIHHVIVYLSYIFHCICVCICVGPSVHTYLLSLYNNIKYSSMHTDKSK